MKYEELFGEHTHTSAEASSDFSSFLRIWVLCFISKTGTNPRSLKVIPLSRPFLLVIVNVYTASRESLTVLKSEMIKSENLSFNNFRIPSG